MNLLSQAGTARRLDAGPTGKRAQKMRPHVASKPELMS
jgi:hypothetical protein